MAEKPRRTPCAAAIITRNADFVKFSFPFGVDTHDYKYLALMGWPCVAASANRPRYAHVVHRTSTPR